MWYENLIIIRLIYEFENKLKIVFVRFCFRVDCRIKKMNLTTFTLLSCSVFFQGFKYYTIKQLYSIQKLSNFKREVTLNDFIQST